MANVLDSTCTHFNLVVEPMEDMPDAGCFVSFDMVVSGINLPAVALIQRFAAHWTNGLLVEKLMHGQLYPSVYDVRVPFTTFGITCFTAGLSVEQIEAKLEVLDEDLCHVMNHPDWTREPSSVMHDEEDDDDEQR